MIDVLAHNHAPDETWVLEWLSSPRLQTYLDASGNNLQRALRLYEWNIDLGQTLMKDIAFFEVALRNLINECRNRIAHQEPLFHDADGIRNPAVVDGLVVDLFHELLPQADVFEPDATTPVELFLHSSPRP